MTISVNWGPPAGAYGGLLAKSAQNQQFADLMMPYAQQYAQQAFTSGEAAKGRTFESEEQAKQREWQAAQEKARQDFQAQQSEYDRQLSWYKLTNPYGSSGQPAERYPGSSLGEYWQSKIQDQRMLPGIVGARSTYV